MYILSYITFYDICAVLIDVDCHIVCCCCGAAGIDREAEVQLVRPLKEGEGLGEGAELTLKCQAEGNAEPTVEWFRNKFR